MAAQVTSSISTIFNGYTNPPITNPKAPRPSPPTSLRLQGGSFIQVPSAPRKKGAQAISRQRKDTRREENPARRHAACRVFVMKNAPFVEFILQIRGACLFLHIVNKRHASMRTKNQTSRPKQTLRDVSYKGARQVQSKRQMRLPNRQHRPQTARPTTLTIERPEYHEKTTHILNGIGGPAGGRMLHGKQG